MIKKLDFRRRKLIMAAYYDVKLTGKISNGIKRVAKTIKKVARLEKK